MPTLIKLWTLQHRLLNGCGVSAETWVKIKKRDVHSEQKQVKTTVKLSSVQKIRAIQHLYGIVTESKAVVFIVETYLNKHSNDTVGYRNVVSESALISWVIDEYFRICPVALPHKPNK